MFVCFSNITFIEHYLMFIISQHLFHGSDGNMKAESDLSHWLPNDSMCSISQKSDLNGGQLGVSCLNILRVIITVSSLFANSE